MTAAVDDEPTVAAVAELLQAACPHGTNHAGTARSVLRRLRRLGWAPAPVTDRLRPIRDVDPLLNRADQRKET
jgi:hypothetical protein